MREEFDFSWIFFFFVCCCGFNFILIFQSLIEICCHVLRPPMVPDLADLESVVSLTAG